MSDSDSTRAPRYPFTRGNTPAEPAARNPANDPLTELARLIGQRDPFVDPVPEAARRDLRDILAGRRKDDWPNAPEPPIQQDYDDSTPHVEVNGHFPATLAVDELPRAPQGYEDQPPPYASHTDYGREPPDAPLYGDNGQLVPDDEYSEYQQFAPENYAPEHQVAGSPPRRGKGLFAVIAVFGLAVVGTAGAYAYRTFYSGGVPGTPPLIRADSAPNKIAATPAGDAGSGKQIYDRLGSDRPQNEKVVSREEQPVDVRPAQPRSAFPATSGQSGAVPSGSAGNGPLANGWPMPAGTTPAAPVPAGVAASANEPRRIRTIPIRADQLATAPPSEAPPAVAAPSASVPARTQPTRQAVATTVVAPAAAPNAPLSLNPQATQQRASKPMRTAAVSAEAAPSGVYVVQLAANKTQEEASAAFRAAKAKYPDVLGNRKLLIRKKEIAGKGTFYGAQVGPFASRQDAVQLCEDLKSAGGSCIVQRN